MATAFGRERFMAFFLFYMIFFGAISRLVNGACCVKVAHTTRIAIVTLFTFGSFVAISLACFNDHNPDYFFVAVFASIFTGIS